VSHCGFCVSSAVYTCTVNSFSYKRAKWYVGTVCEEIFPIFLCVVWWSSFGGWVAMPVLSLFLWPLYAPIVPSVLYCDNMQCSRSVPAFERNLFPHFRLSWDDSRFLQTAGMWLIRQHGIMCQKTAIWMLATLITSDLIFLFCDFF